MVGPRDPCRRARQLAREGAYRKGLQSLTGSTASFSTVEQRTWATKLLPSSSLPGSACYSRTAQPDLAASSAGEGASAGADSDRFASKGSTHAPTSLWGQALMGVHFPALSAAGPSGMRPEHLRDALLAKRRSSVNRLLKAVAELGRRGAHTRTSQRAPDG